MSSKPSMLKGLSDYISRNTRFDPSQIRLENHKESTTDVPIRVKRSHGIKYEMSRQRIKGPLPEGVRAVDPAQFESTMMDYADRNKAELPEMARAWMDADGVVLTETPPNKKFLKYREPIGTEELCEDCAGRGVNTCKPCGGHGKTPCRNCGGYGNVTCLQCNGTRRLRCYDCHSGYRTVNGRQERCLTCLGNGYRHCHDCDYLGKVRCQSCSGSGEWVCGGCHGRGKVNCGGCDATGLISEVVDLDCAIEGRYQVYGGNYPDTEVEEFVKSKFTVQLAAKFAILEPADFRYEAGVIERTFQGHMPVGTLTFKLNSKDFLIHNYGPEAEVFDYKDLANELLNQDLADLKRKSSYSALYSFPKLTGLFEAAGLFLKSELNQVIGLGAATDQKVPRSLLKGAMSQEAIDDSWRAINKAFDILLEGCLILPSVPVWLVATAAMAIAPMFLPDWGNAILAGLFLGVSALGYGLLRLITRYRFKRYVGTNMFDSLVKSNRFKVANKMYITVTLAILTGLYIQDWVPIFR